MKVSSMPARVNENQWRQQVQTRRQRTDVRDLEASEVECTELFELLRTARGVSR
mgnify:CR=1 FL=1